MWNYAKFKWGEQFFKALMLEVTAEQQWCCKEKKDSKLDLLNGVMHGGDRCSLTDTIWFYVYEHKHLYFLWVSFTFLFWGRAS